MLYIKESKNSVFYYADYKGVRILVRKAPYKKGYKAKCYSKRYYPFESSYFSSPEECLKEVIRSLNLT